MSESQKQTAAQEMIGDFAPKLVSFTDDLLVGDIWERPGLSKRDRSLTTVTALVALYRTDQIAFHLRKALENGLTTDELTEAITHLAFYSGWPNAMTAISALKSVVAEVDQSQDRVG
ncbi:MAG: carboxymuconolactone decarboxylase family protein [Thermoleophilia bacterium]